EAARRGYGESIALLPANAAAVGLAENSFDFVIARLLFQHLADPMPVAREAFRLLKPGGIFVIVDIDYDIFGPVVPHVPDFRRCPRRLAPRPMIPASARPIRRCPV